MSNDSSVTDEPELSVTVEVFMFCAHSEEAVLATFGNTVGKERAASCDICDDSGEDISYEFQYDEGEEALADEHARLLAALPFDLMPIVAVGADDHLHRSVFTKHYLKPRLLAGVFDASLMVDDRQAFHEGYAAGLDVTAAFLAKGFAYAAAFGGAVYTDATLAKEYQPDTPVNTGHLVLDNGRFVGWLYLAFHAASLIHPEGYRPELNQKNFAALCRFYEVPLA